MLPGLHILVGIDHRNSVLARRDAGDADLD
jgi:hypothetical protein